MIVPGKLSSRVRSYLAYDSPSRRALADVLDAIVASCPDTVVFGGMLREFALGSAREFYSDIDLVTTAGDDRLYQVIRRFAPRQNRFGGFRFVAEKYRFDIWSFANTWAFRNGYVDGRTWDDLLRTTFFNVDAALFHLGMKKLVWAEAFKAGVEDRRLEINLEPNASPSKMAKRAIEFALRYQLSIGPCLGAYISSNADKRELSWGEAAFLNDLESHLRIHPESSFMHCMPELDFGARERSDGKRH